MCVPRERRRNLRWRGREWGACSAFFWSETGGGWRWRAVSGKLLGHPFWNCLFLTCVKHETLLVRSAAGNNTYSDTLMLTFCQGKTRCETTKCRRAPDLGIAHVRVEQVEKRFICFSIQDEKKWHIYSDSWASTAWKCSIVYLYCSFLGCGFFF